MCQLEPLFHENDMAGMPCMHVDGMLTWVVSGFAGLCLVLSRVLIAWYKGPATSRYLDMCVWWYHIRRFHKGLIDLIEVVF